MWSRSARGDANLRHSRSVCVFASAHGQKVGRGKGARTLLRFARWLLWSLVIKITGPEYVTPVAAAGARSLSAVRITTMYILVNWTPTPPRGSTNFAQIVVERASQIGGRGGLGAHGLRRHVLRVFV